MSRSRPGAAIAVALILAGCAAVPDAAPPAAPPDRGSSAPVATALPAPPPPPHAGRATARLALPTNPERIAARIAELEEARKNGAGADADGTLELALLYSHPDNPAPDPARALAAMRAYLALAPPQTRDPLTGHIVKLLEEVDALGRAARDSQAREKELVSRAQALERKLAECEQREAAAKKREQELLAQIKTLQKQIEQLQKLDLEMERRRRSVR